MSFGSIIYEVSEHVAHIHLNRPRCLNALNRQTYAELNAALDLAESDKAVRVILLAGEGRAFSVGADLNEHAALGSTDEQQTFLGSEQSLGRRLYRLEKPIVAAVHGYALGAGAELAIACDFVVMAESARVGFPEVAIGNFLGGGAIHMLPRLVGLAKARNMIFLGEQVDGREAVRVGLANRSFADDRLQDGAAAFAGQIAANAPIAMRLAKEQLNMAAERDFEAILTAELEAMITCSSTADWQEGLRAFAEKRKPVFRGE